MHIQDTGCADSKGGYYYAILSHEKLPAKLVEELFDNPPDTSDWSGDSEVKINTYKLY